MKTINENTVYLRDSLLKKVLMIICTICAVVSTVFIILIYFCICRNNNCSDEVALLRSEVDSLKDVVNSFENRIVALEESNVALWANLDSTNIRISELENCCEKKNTIKRLQSENKKVRTQINVYRASLNEVAIPLPLLQGPVSYSNVDTLPVVDSVKEEISTRALSLQVVKTSFYKKNSVQKTFLYYSAPVSFSSVKGFSEDKLIYNYPYVNENNDSLNFQFRSFVYGNSLLLDVHKNEEALLSENKKFPLGEESLMFMKSFQSMQVDWTSQRFLERSVDPNRFKKGNREILTGIPLAIAGGIGTWYFFTHPVATINVYEKTGTCNSCNVNNVSNGKDEKVFSKEIWNDFGKGVSIAATAAGTFLTVKGCIDKRLSWTLTPVEISLRYDLSKEPR